MLPMHTIRGRCLSFLTLEGNWGATDQNMTVRIRETERFATGDFLGPEFNGCGALFGP